MKARDAVDTEAVLWSRESGGWRLDLRGDWRGRSQPLAPAPAPGPVAGEAVRVRCGEPGAWIQDRDAAPRLWALLAPLRRTGALIDLAALPDALRGPLELALPAPGSAIEPVPEHVDAGGIAARLRAGWEDALQTAAFLGEVMLSLSRLLRGKAVMRASDYFRQLDLVGPMSLPIVSLTCFLIGLMLAYMGGAQLERIGAQSFIADVVTVGMVRELAGLMTGVILAGRVGAAFAAQLGSMRANEEIDALRALGIDPIDYLVLPRLLAMLTMAPLLIAYAALVGVLAGLPPVVGIYGVPALEYLHKSEQVLTWTHLWIGLFKGTMYIGLVALAGCREGLHAGRDAQSVGAATTTAVVKGLLWIVVAASASTVFFQRLGL
ncbi:MAG: hypothetical protein ABS84_12615 [Rubrivivax sp. SCN 71-131]|nr:MAG: hypothetical protein ABS84_12615 [Rubrivivax sp. SCN 71-131]